MSTAFKKPVRAFVILTYLLFWILFSITGALVFSGAPEIYQTVMKNVCAWSSTFVLLLFFRRFKPNTSLAAFLKRQFPEAAFSDFFLPMLLQISIAVLAAAAVIMVNQISIGSIEFISAASIPSLLLINITSGPMGEELGWRAYALVELNKKHNLLFSSIITGVIWGLWHFPLWLVSGFSGLNLIYYVCSFMIGITSFSVFISFFYIRKKNILIAVWIHFLFNILMQIVVFNTDSFILFMFFVSILYLLVSLIIVLRHRSTFFADIPNKGIPGK